MTYAREVVRFANYLRSTFNLGLLDSEIMADGDRYLDGYRQTLTRPDEFDSGSHPVGDASSTLGKRRAALKRFYSWAVQAHHIESFPFQLVAVRTRNGSIETLARMRGGRRTHVERLPIPTHQIDRFFRVGVLGQAPDGLPDTSFTRFRTVNRTAAAFALGLAAGLRHSEILAVTIFEIPKPHPDGLTPVAVADQISKGDWGRRVVGFSDWLDVCWKYIDGDRRVIARRAQWRPVADELTIDVAKTNAAIVTYERGGRNHVSRWRDLDIDHRRRLVVSGHGSPLFLLNQHARDGSPLTDDSSLNTSLKDAGRRCRQLWPDENWAFSMHNLRHTFGTELSRFVSHREQLIETFIDEHGRQPVWAEMLRREDPAMVVQDSMGHSDPRTTKIYTHTALWDLLLSVNADPKHNPALRENV